LKEEDVLRIAFTWVEADLPARRSHLQRVLGCVRFGQMNVKSVQEYAAYYGVDNVEVVKEAITYLTAIEELDLESAGMLRTSYKETPAFALPRLPKQFMITIGGFSSSAPKSGIEVFDPSSDRWSSLPVSLQQGLAYSTAQYLDGRIFILGGVSGQTRMLRNIYIFDIDVSSIVSGVPMKEQRAYATSAQMGSIIYVFGGKGSPLNQVRMKSCEKLDTRKSPMNWERIAPMEDGKGDAGAVVVNGKVMVVGGFSGQHFLSSVEIYNPSTNTWQRGPSLQAARSGMGLAVLDGVVYIAGGHRGTGRLRSVERLLPGAKRWVKVASMGTKRSNFSLVSIDGKLVAAGGYDGMGVTDVVEVYHPESDQWQEVNSLPTPKSALSAVVVPREELTRKAQERCRYQKRGDLMEEELVKSLAKLEISSLSSLYIEDSSDENSSDTSADNAG